LRAAYQYQPTAIASASAPAAATLPGLNFMVGLTHKPARGAHAPGTGR
jgi:hypothetical protein